MSFNFKLNRFHTKVITYEPLESFSWRALMSSILSAFPSDDDAFCSSGVLGWTNLRTTGGDRNSSGVFGWTTLRTTGGGDNNSSEIKYRFYRTNCMKTWNMESTQMLVIVIQTKGPDKFCVISDSNYRLQFNTE